MLVIHATRFFTNNRDRTVNGVEKYSFDFLNAKLLVKIRFRTLLLLPEHHYQNDLFCLKFLHILATNRQFTDLNLISKTVYSLIVQAATSMQLQRKINRQEEMQEG